MLAQQTPTRSPAMEVQFLIFDVRHVGDWLTRECPECHRTGYVSIYPKREPEARAYITHPDWMCKLCAEIQREVDRNFCMRGGDAPVN